MQNLQLTSRQKFRFGLARPGQARPKGNFCLEVKRRFCTSGMVTLYFSLEVSTTLCLGNAIVLLHVNRRSFLLTVFCAPHDGQMESAYRVTHHLESYLSLASKQKLCFSIDAKNYNVYLALQSTKNRTQRKSPYVLLTFEELPFPLFPLVPMSRSFFPPLFFGEYLLRNLTQIVHVLST